MVEGLEGNGFLFDGGQLVAPVRYRLNWSTDDAGRSRAEGELRLRCRGPAEGIGGGPYMLYTGAGFSVPLEVTAAGDEGWLAFRRTVRRKEEMGDELG
ncbi:MAG TPA: hypothetical protein VKA55_04105 [Gammaproteobacteria bacterium]|nr:hypothetical protein [Gammaproteobacteria bacterium]